MKLNKKIKRILMIGLLGASTICVPTFAAVSCNDSTDNTQQVPNDNSDPNTNDSGSQNSENNVDKDGHVLWKRQPQKKLLFQII